MSMRTEFQEFAVKGNVVDLAVGVVIRGRFWEDRIFVRRGHYHAADRPVVGWSRFQISGDYT